MNRWLRDLILILALAGLWAISGYAIGAAIEALGLDHYPFGVICASLNLILGMSLFLGITKDPTAERIFFEGPRRNEPGHPASVVTLLASALRSTPLLGLVNKW